jgi:hypothetical protein
MTGRAVDGVYHEMSTPVDDLPVDRRVCGDHDNDICPIDECQEWAAFSLDTRRVAEEGHVRVVEANVGASLGQTGQDVGRG